jgi:toxin YoeB
MNLIFSTNAWEDDLKWQSQDKRILKRINRQITEIQRSPVEGIGKVEPRKHGLSDYWSRRIDRANRAVYKADEERVRIMQLSHHD